jgi:hypothetical protein
MSEHLKQPEHGQGHEHAVDHEHHKRVEAHKAAAAEQAKREKSAENLAKIREMAQAHAETASKIKTEEAPKDETESMVGVQHSLKSNAYARTLAKIQSRLPAPTRTFSRLAHNPVVDKISAAGAQTVGRPSGVLGGSICAFLGSLTILYYSKHYGFRYNYLVLFVLFVGGFAAGATLEVLIWLLYSRKRRY